MHSSLSVDVAAPSRRVFELAGDLPRWPALLPHYVRVDVERRVGQRLLAMMIALRRIGPLALPIVWRAQQWAEGDDPSDLRLRFSHVRGVTRGMEVTWHIRPTETGCRVTIEHDFRRPLPLLGDELLPRLVDRFFIRPVAGRTLATFKALAESPR